MTLLKNANGTAGLTYSGLDARTDGLEATVALHSSSYDVDPTGVADSTDGLADLFAASAAQNKRAEVAPGTYKLTGNTPFLLASGADLHAQGEVILDMSAMDSGNKWAIRAVGSGGTELPLASNGVKGKYQVVLSDASSLAVGDWVQVGSHADYYSYDGSDTQADRGEFKRIKAISTNTLTFETVLYDNYPTAKSAFVREVTFVENITIEGFTIRGNTAANSNEYGIYLEYVNGFRIAGNIIEDTDINGITVGSSIRGEVTNNRVRLTHYDGTTGTIFYGCALYDSCQWVRIHHNHFERCRHAVVSSSRAHDTAPARFGQPRFCTIDNNIAENMMASGPGHSWGLEHHGFGEGMVWRGNIVDSAYGGMSIEGGNLLVEGNYFYGWHNVGINWDANGRLCENVTVRNNVIVGGGTTNLDSGGSESTSTAPNAIRFELGAGTPATSVKNLVIEGNTIEQDLTLSYAIYLQLISTGSGGLVTAQNAVIANNTIRNTAATEGTEIAIYTATHAGIHVIGNRVHDGRCLVRCDGADCVIEGNRLYNAANISTSSTAIDVRGARTVVAKNVLRRVYRGVRVETGGSAVVIVDNVIDIGTANTAREVTFGGSGAASMVRNNVHVADTALDTIASATALTLSASGDVFKVSGTTTITSITARWPGARVSLIFTGILTLTDGSNLKLGGDFVTSADDAIDLVCDGTNWYQTGPGSAN